MDNNEEKILEIVNTKSQISLNKEISKDKVIIVDFFNIYCNIVKFNKYKTFSRETFIKCLDLILKKFKDYQVLIIAKNVFEIEIEYIKNITIINKNITYIIVEDTHYIKSINKNRDDYVCLLYHNFLFTDRKQQSIIITNDKHRDFKLILTNTKSIKLHIYKQGYVSTFDLDKRVIRKYNTGIFKNLENKINSCEFTLI